MRKISRPVFRALAAALLGAAAGVLAADTAAPASPPAPAATTPAPLAPPPAPAEVRESAGTIPPVTLTETMRTLDEKVAALSSLLGQGEAAAGPGKLQADVHAIEQIIARLDELTADRPAAGGRQVNAEQRSTALEELARNFRLIREAAEAGDMLALERAYKQVDLRASCQGCHRAYGKTVEFPSQKPAP